MNRSDIIEAVAPVVGNHALAREAVDMMVSTIASGMAEGERVHISGLGSFTGEVVPSRMVRNPATGAKVRAKKTGRVRFRPATSLKALIARKNRAK